MGTSRPFYLRVKGRVLLRVLHGLCRLDCLLLGSRRGHSHLRHAANGFPSFPLARRKSIPPAPRFWPLAKTLVRAFARPIKDGAPEEAPSLKRILFTLRPAWPLPPRLPSPGQQKGPFPFAACRKWVPFLSTCAAEINSACAKVLATGQNSCTRIRAPHQRWGPRRGPIFKAYSFYSASCMAFAASIAFSWAAGGASS